MAQPEFSGGGENPELDKAFWDLIDGTDVEVELAIHDEEVDYPKLWMGNACVAVDTLAGETFRESMLRAAASGAGASDAATAALRQELWNPIAHMRLGERMACRGVGVALEPPTEQYQKFREIHIDERLFIIGCLEDALYDQYWHVKTRRAHNPMGGGAEQGSGQSVTWLKQLLLGPVVVLSDAKLYAIGGSLIELYPQLRVPLAEPSLQPLKVH